MVCFRICPGDAICTNGLVPGIPFAQEELLVDGANGEFDIYVYPVVRPGKREPHIPQKARSYPGEELHFVYIDCEVQVINF